MAEDETVDEVDQSAPEYLGDDEFAARLSSAIKARGLSLQRLRHRLADHGVTVSAATLSYWQNGRSRPTRAHSQNILTALEEVLELDAGSLVAAAPATPTRRRTGNAARSHAPMPRTVEEVLESTGLDPLNLRKVSSHITVTINRDRTASSEVVRNVVQCLRSGTHAFPVVVEHDEVQQEVHGLSNCSTGGVWDLPEQGLRVIEMRLARPLRQGEYMMMEYMTTLSEGSEASREFMIATPKLSDLVVEVQFPPLDVPASVVGYSRSLDSDPGPEAAEDAQPLPVSQGLAQLIRVDVTPALHVVRWAWDEPAADDGSHGGTEDQISPQAEAVRTARH